MEETKRLFEAEQ